MRKIPTPSIFLLTPCEELQKYLVSLLEGEGFTLNWYGSEDEIFKDLCKKEPKLIILEYETTNSIEICKKIRRFFRLRCIPLIVLVDKEHTIEKIKSIYAGADDYIEKPINPAELLTRIKLNLWRAERDLDANPLTKLPGNVSIIKELKSRIENRQQFCAGYLDLDNFKEHNDYYGFKWGDQIIKHLACVLASVIEELGSPSDFLGHIGGDDFIFVIEPDGAEFICKKIIESFDSSILSLYKEEDRQRGYILVKNREGKLYQTRFLTLSIGITTTGGRSFEHVGEVVEAITELKNYAKRFPRSIYIMDRRRS